MDKEDSSIFKEVNWNDSTGAFRWSLIVGIALIIIMISLSILGTERDNIGLIMSLVVLILINATPALYKFLYISSNLDNQEAEENHLNIEEVVLKFLMCWFSVIFAIILLFTRIEGDTILYILTSLAAVIVLGITTYIIYSNPKAFKQILTAVFSTLKETFKSTFKILLDVMVAVFEILETIIKNVFNKISTFLNNRNK